LLFASLLGELHPDYTLENLIGQIRKRYR